MKTWKKTLCLVGAVILLSLSGVIIWQMDNIQPLILYLQADSDEIAEQKEQTYQDHQKELEEELGSSITVTLPSDEQSSALMDGTRDPEEVKQELGVSGGLNQPAETLPQDKLTKENLVNQCAAELSACKVDVMANLGKLKSETLAQWTALPAEERTSSKKMQLGMAALRQCYAYEVEVDAAVQACLDRYRGQLEAIGEDPSVMDTLWNQYCKEKETEKAYYLDKYLN